eukprot:maker-scaffold95_size379157-snap-gene-2.32 protein:Tk00599 transcript:maker-scaffold95_size379157-snap-gene-2.32-mRNA-1 annotation:"cd63 antigen"
MGGPTGSSTSHRIRAIEDSSTSHILRVAVDLGIPIDNLTMASLFSGKERYMISPGFGSTTSGKASPNSDVRGFANVPGYRNANVFDPELNLGPPEYPTNLFHYRENKPQLNQSGALAQSLPEVRSYTSSKNAFPDDFKLKRAASHGRMHGHSNAMNGDGNYNGQMGRVYPSGSFSHHTHETQSGGQCGERNWRGINVCIAFVLLTASLFLVGVGSGLMGFYRIHFLDMVAVEFIIVPLIMVIGGLLTLATAVFGFYISFKEESCLMISYAFSLIVQFLLLVAAVVLSIRLIFEIQTGLFDSDAVSEMAYYETSQWTRTKWDTLQREFTCCGAYNFNQGYLNWKQTSMGAARNSVPDSCCLHESAQCGHGIFDLTDQRLVMQTIYVHGCITIMQVRLKAHVIVILYVFVVIGSIVAIIELLGIVLAFCMASQYSQTEQEPWEFDYNIPLANQERTQTPNTMVSAADYSSQHGTHI